MLLFSESPQRHNIFTLILTGYEYYKFLTVCESQICVTHCNSSHTEIYGLSLDCQWIRACGGALLCCNKSEKDCWRNLEKKSEIGKLYESRKNVHKK